MTDRDMMMRRMEDLLASIKEYHASGALDTAKSIIDFTTGYVQGTREEFDKDNEEGRYGT